MGDFSFWDWNGGEREEEEYWVLVILRIEHTFAIAVDIGTEIVSTTLSIH